MPANLKNPFGESCCDGGACNPNDFSAQSCGCDERANHMCSYHTAYSEGYEAGYHQALNDAMASERGR